MIIDAHTHMMNLSFFDRLAEIGGAWAKERVSMGRGLAQRKPHFVDVGRRLQHLGQYGIDFQVITPEHSYDCNGMPGDLSARLACCRILNDGLAEIMEKSKGKLIAGGNIPLLEFERGGRQELERVVRDLGFKAVTINSNINGKPIDSDEFLPFWATVAEMDVPVYIHPTDPCSAAGRSYEAEYDLVHNFGWPYETVLALARLVFSGIMERYPNLKIVSHHLGGGMIPFFMGRTLETYEPQNQKDHYKGMIKDLPKPLFDYFALFYYDTAVGGSAAAIRCAYEVFGSARMIFATDYPFGPGSGESRLRDYPKVIDSLDISFAEKEKILSDNAQQMLKLGQR
jgi:predicted TIM-barrel fold metal-dependent hydrolase